MAELERAGKPTVGFVAKRFEGDWRASAGAFGVEQLRYVVFPEVLTGITPESIRSYTDDNVDEIVQLLTKSLQCNGSKGVAHPAETEVLTFNGSDRYDAVQDMNREYLDSGWGDGYPLLPPTPEAVAAILKGTRRAPGDVVAIVEPGMGVATVEKMAINAAMAGCSAEHLPLLIAAVEAMATKPFPLRNLTQSTGGQGLLFVVNGPIAGRLGINGAQNALDVGKPSRVNVMLARALRLIMLNIGHDYPGHLDMATIGAFRGLPFLTAENELRSPWAPYHVDRGHARATSTITVCGRSHQVDCEDLQNWTAERVLTSIAGYSSTMPHGGYSMIATNDEVIDHSINLNILLAPDHAKSIVRDGVTKQGAKEYILNHAKFRAKFAKNHFVDDNQPAPQWRWILDLPDDHLLQVVDSAERVNIFVVGGEAGRSVVLEGFGTPVTREIETGG
ncbi:MAG: hypothetical protein QF714_10225 [Dehalococcoidia bacterium]|jgi:hypothetical protein|nr:hypothetical protein [Dehalococcoidia bacterium]MDP6228057.1 hypothetical protein [Dehalococcoidia bacterium]MDP7085481.1 hypothetical protein [Dehalococcoidia bacterium]MDP7202221.1 hypothetical protein [Dehalococcoidia bacterium]HJN88228.1 hypothetical protein [Dehalococcoidia bacterium]